MIYAFSIMEILIGLFLFLMLVIGTANDRRHYPTGKWISLILCIFVISIYVYFNNPTLNIIDLLTSSEFLIGLGIYIGLGFVYATFEFFVSMLKASKNYNNQWVTFKSNYPCFEYKYIQYMGHSEDLDKSSTSEILLANVKVFVKSSVQQYDFLKINVNMVNGALKIEPKIETAVLIHSLAVWIFLWPAYLTSLFISDLIFNFFGNTLSKLSKGLISLIFKNTFKI